MTKGKDNTNAKMAVSILVWLIENNKLKDIRAGKLMEAMDIDRRVLRRYFDCFVDAGIADVKEEGITKVYALKVKLPKGPPKEKKSKNQIAREKMEWQNEVKFTKNPLEPIWEMDARWNSLVATTAGQFQKRFDEGERAIRLAYLIGMCRTCKKVYAASEFNQDRWECKGCFAKWLHEGDVFRTDSESEIVE